MFVVFLKLRNEYEQYVRALAVPQDELIRRATNLYMVVLLQEKI